MWLQARGAARSDPALILHRTGRTTMYASDNKRLRLLGIVMAGAVALSVGACNRTPNQETGQSNAPGPGNQASNQPANPSANPSAKPNPSSGMTSDAGRAVEDAALTAKVKTALVAE